MPHRDLRITKGHSLFIDNVLIPVEFLVNHRSILWDDRVDQIEYYHVELVRHAVLLADGAPAETYRDDGNRWLFSNANSGWDQAPKPPCAAVLTGGPIVDGVWRRLLDRAGPRPGLPLTDEADMHLMVDGKRMDAVSRYGMASVFRLRGAPRSVRVVSRSAAPAELGLARDPRQLGVALKRILIQQGKRLRVMEAADALLRSGFHGFEPELGVRWTDGNADLPPELYQDFDGVLEIVLHVESTARYPLDAAPPLRAAA